MELTNIILKQHYFSEEDNTLTLCFHTPIALLGSSYPEAESSLIAVELPISDLEARSAYVMLAPVRGGAPYAWLHWDIPYEDIERLMDLARDVIVQYT